MANHGNTFVSVNLNKSYGKQQQPYSHYTHYPPAGRGRGGSAVSGGMVVLSRNRGAAPKIVPKLSIPPPLNLPSLRKEHEKFDTLGPGGPGGGAGTGSGSRPTSSGVGWNKPVAATTTLPERNDSAVDIHGINEMDDTAVLNRGVHSYMPPSARSNGMGLVGSGLASRDFPQSARKSMVLRGEDFPSLQDARPASSGASHKQKDGLNQKQKQVTGGESKQDKRDNSQFGPMLDVHSLVQPARSTVGSSSMVNADEGHGMGRERMADPLPLVHLTPRSDWADDERDTGHRFVEQGRDFGYSKPENYWDRDFGFPKSSILPQKPAQNQYKRLGQRDNETGKNSSSEVQKMDLHAKDLRAPSREGMEANKWRNSPIFKDGSGKQESGIDRTDAGARLVDENKYIPPCHENTGRDGSPVVYWDATFVKKDLGVVGRQPQWNNSMESYNNRGTYRNAWDRHAPEQSNRFQHRTSKSSFVSNGKLPPVFDPILNMGRDKRSSKDDYGSTLFDETDLFSGDLVGVIKRKKDAARPTDFHDPVRESFEAELERVQKMQELERQRIVEEQERVQEQARREEEERQRRITEEEERQRRVENEAREAAWRAEQEHFETIRKAEEQRIAREEERRRMELEEERRKQAAKQKLLELEAKMAMREVESVKGDVVSNTVIMEEKLEKAVKEKESTRTLDMDTWEDCERMVEKVTTSASFDSPAYVRPIQMSMRPYPPREGSSNFVDRGKDTNSWRRDAFDDGSGFPPLHADQGIGHYGQKRDAFGGGRAVPQKEFHEEAAYMSRSYPIDEFGYQKEQRWNLSGNADSYGNVGSEYPDNVADRYGDDGWSRGCSRVNTRSPYPERLYPNPEANELHSYGRSRYSMRQPHVLPPPLLASAQRINFTGVAVPSGPSAFSVNDTHYRNASRGESTRQPAYYSNDRGGFGPSEIVDMQHENTPVEDRKLSNTSRCDSQSSLSVSSPPNSPPLLSHDELDESGDSRLPSAVEEGTRSLLPHSGPSLNSNLGDGAIMMPSDSVYDIEDEEWIPENDESLQQQEEYDEDEDGYREGDEVHEGDDENLELNKKFGLELEESESSHTMENIVLGFDEGVEVLIPSDDSERNLGSPEGPLGIHGSFVGILEERGLVDGIPSNEPTLVPAHDSSGSIADGSSSNILQSESALEESISEAVADSSGSSCLSAQQSVFSSGDDISPSLYSAASVAGEPITLQFGLFSGPSLIPTPVPAIQIGSIQLPLHIHPSRPPLFHFGQLHYTSPISQGILPMPAQSISFVQPNVQRSFNLNQNVERSVPRQPIVSAQNMKKDELPSHTVIKQTTFVQSTISGVSGASDKIINPESVVRAESRVQSVSGNKNFSRQRGLGLFSGGSGKRFAYAVKNANMRSFSEAQDMQADSNGFQRRPRQTVQRTEFRIRDNSERRQAPLLISSRSTGSDGRFNSMEKAPRNFTRSGFKRGTISNRTMKQIIESVPSTSGNLIYQELNSGYRATKDMSKSLFSKSQNTSNPGEPNLREDVCEDVDAPLQSGVVRVFKQPGIEAASDGDGFIEVRSKRQMLNDRREQREREIKEKSRTLKQQRKPRPTRQIASTSISHNRLSPLLGNEVPNNSHLEFTTSDAPHLTGSEVSTGLITAASLAPIGTPAVNHELQAIKPLQAAPVAVVCNDGTNETGIMPESKNKLADHVESSQATWSTAGNQRVMSLTQTQLDEAMKPARYDSHISTVGVHASTDSDPILPTPSVLAKDKIFSSGSSPINSLLAGEKIQFGAVTSPTVLPPSSRVISHGIGAPGSNRPDVQMSRNFPEPENDSSLFLEKEKYPNDCEAQAEAAASAIVVAVISSDEIIGHGSDSANVPDAKDIGADVIDSITIGVVGDQQLVSQLRAEESLSVSLPADLSVETTPISLWPPSLSPQSSSNQMLSHFPGCPPAHFPFYDMNPILGGPIFAFSPRGESSGLQSQSQMSTTPTSGPLGNWHSGMDSFYGPPAGYPGPFISSPSGVQGPPHMVVYNHFAPVGQYGQVGLSYMGTTYIPSGKQADWKHTQSTSAMHVGERDMNNINIMSTVQRSSPNMTPPIQQLATGSPLLPMASPLPMFELPPFQGGPDLSVQARWGHIPTSPLHSVPMSRPLQPQVEGAQYSQANQAHFIDQSSTVNKFSESRTPPSVTSSDTNNAPFPTELGSVGSSRSIATSSGQCVVVIQSSNAEPVQTAPLENRNMSSVKTQFSSKSASVRQSGYNYQRGGVMSNRNNNAGNEWSYRKTSFHGRSQSTGVDKGNPALKVKQIYVPKQTTSANSTN